MQRPSVRSLWPDTMNPFSESFKDLTIVLLVNCLSLRRQIRHERHLDCRKKQISLDLIFDLLILAFCVPVTPVYFCHFWLSFVTVDIFDGLIAVEWGTLVAETERRCIIAKT